MAIVDIRNLEVVLGKDFQALKDVNLELSGDKIVGIIGPSGAGKTTLVRAIVGRQKIKSGDITILGRPAGSPDLRSRLNYMTQEVSIYADLTVTQNLRYFARMQDLKGDAITLLINDLLQEIDLSSQAKQLVGKLSGGQKQRVSLAVALIGKPEVMVLDEPTVGLDPVLRDQIWQLLHKIKARGTAIIITSHAMDEAERCEDLVLIRDGQILAHGSPQGLCDKTNTRSVEQSFLKLVGSQG